MTPMTRVISPYTKSKKPKEHKAVIIPDTNIICLEPEKITGTKVKVVEESSTQEKATESVTIEPQTKTDTDTRVNHTDANSDAIHKDNIEKALKKFITSTTDIKYDAQTLSMMNPKKTKSQRKQNQI